MFGSGSDGTSINGRSCWLPDGLQHVCLAIPRISCLNRLECSVFGDYRFDVEVIRAAEYYKNTSSQVSAPSHG